MHSNIEIIYNGTFYICPVCKRNMFSRPFQPHICNGQFIKRHGRIARRLGIKTWDSYDMKITIEDK